MAGWKERCPEGRRCGQADCPKCSPSSILPAHRRGSKKRNGIVTSSSRFEVSTRDGLRLGDTYQTLDGAIVAARKLRKACTIARAGHPIVDVSASGTVTPR